MAAGGTLRFVAVGLVAGGGARCRAAAAGPPSPHRPGRRRGARAPQASLAPVAFLTIFPASLAVLLVVDGASTLAIAVWGAVWSIAGALAFVRQNWILGDRHRAIARERDLRREMLAAQRGARRAHRPRRRRHPDARGAPARRARAAGPDARLRRPQRAHRARRRPSHAAARRHGARRGSACRRPAARRPRRAARQRDARRARRAVRAGDDAARRRARRPARGRPQPHPRLHGEDPSGPARSADRHLQPPRAAGRADPGAAARPPRGRRARAHDARHRRLQVDQRRARPRRRRRGAAPRRRVRSRGRAAGGHVRPRSAGRSSRCSRPAQAPRRRCSSPSACGSPSRRSTCCPTAASP